MVGKIAEVRAPGLVFVDGALWQAHAADGSELVAGEQVKVQAVDGLQLTVGRWE
jgi:membrane protein implicated in regulation of membrane protease activity